VAKSCHVFCLWQLCVLCVLYQNPTVLDWSPRKGPCSGGTLVTVTGLNLHYGSTVKVMMNRLSAEVVRLISWHCYFVWYIMKQRQYISCCGMVSSGFKLTLCSHWEVISCCNCCTVMRCLKCQATVSTPSSVVELAFFSRVTRCWSGFSREREPLEDNLTRFLPTIDVKSLDV